MVMVALRGGINNIVQLELHRLWHTKCEIICLMYYQLTTGPLPSEPFEMDGSFPSYSHPEQCLSSHITVGRVPAALYNPYKMVV